MKKLAVSVLFFLAFSSLSLLSGQSKATLPAEQASASTAALSPANEADMTSVREQLFKFLRTSPRLTMAISTDPTLLGYQEYISRYNPELANFISRHPEIGRNPEFYLFANLPGGGNANVPYLFQRAVWPEVVQKSDQDHDVIVFFIFMLIISAILWLLRMLLQNKRWNRVFKAQTEMHTKMLDKLGGNQELFAYLSSEAGRRFMELSPVTAALESPKPGGMLGSVARILAPLQLGIVSTLSGIGLLCIKKYIEDSGALLLVGTLALMLGIGLMLSAGVSWIIARRLGLISVKADAN